MKKVLTILSALIILSTMGYSQTLRFDFGPKGSDVAEGFIGLGSDVYSEETGYGFEPGVLISGFRQSGQQRTESGNLAQLRICTGSAGSGTAESPCRRIPADGSYYLYAGKQTAAEQRTECVQHPQRPPRCRHTAAEQRRTVHQAADGPASDPCQDREDPQIRNDPRKLRKKSQLTDFSIAFRIERIL